MQKINIYEAKTHFSELISKALMGEEIIISKFGKPLVKLVPYKDKKKKRIPGSLKGKITISKDFNDPLPDEILNEFYK